MIDDTTQLSPARRRALRAAAHHLNPVVSISQKGLTPSVLAEIDRCLRAHELIKLRVYGIEREDRQPLLAEICATLHCHDVQQIGKLVVLWRERPVDASSGAPPLERAKSAVTRRRPSAPKTKKQAAALAEARRR